MLTPAELHVMDLTSELANALASLIANGPTRDHDLNEMGYHLHAIQNAVLAQSAARCYPDRFRLLGSTVGMMS